jgi:hypothetical protein
MSTLNVKNIVGNPTSNLGTITSTSNTATFGNSVYFAANGNVGIGTSSPSSRFSVNGNPPSVGTIAAVADSGGTSLALSDNVNSSLYLTHPLSGIARFTTDSGGAISFATNGTTEGARITSAGLLQFNSGYGSVATAYGCRAWVSYNGTGTPAIRGSGNITSITDHGTGEWTVNFSSSMPDTNYGFVFGCQFPTNGSQGTYIGNSTTTSPAVGSLRLIIIHAGAAYDSAHISVAIMR